MRAAIFCEPNSKSAIRQNRTHAKIKRFTVYICLIWLSSVIQVIVPGRPENPVEMNNEVDRQVALSPTQNSSSPAANGEEKALSTENGRAVMKRPLEAGSEIEVKKMKVEDEEHVSNWTAVKEIGSQFFPHTFDASVLIQLLNFLFILFYQSEILF